MRKRSLCGLKTWALLFCLGVLAFAAWIRGEEPSAGRVVEKVLCRGEASQSYALYLPSSYIPDRKWPVIYALDAGARGNVPVEHFRAGAEKYGYIVAGSNNSRNGPVRIVEEALGAMIADTGSRFSLDEKRVYMAGFSGGARVAVAAGISAKRKVAGVIGCGAGFPASMQPTAPPAFAFFGAVGIEDFNYPELRSLDDRLQKIGAVHRLEIFKGGHEWPPESVCTRAIEWMEIQAMKAGLAPRNELFIDEMHSRAEAEARDLEVRNQVYDAYRLYRAMTEDFAGLKDVHSYETKARELKSTREVTREIDREEASIAKQARLEMDLGGLLAGSLDGPDRALRFQELIRQFIRLRGDLVHTNHESDRLVSRRILDSFWVRLNEEVSSDFESRNYGRAALRLELMAEIRPENASVFFHLARARILGGERKKAIKALNDAVARGFRRPADLQESPDFKTLREDPAFQKILDRITNKQN